MKTFATDKGDHWVLNGSKMWISGGHTCDTGLVYAATTEGGGAKGLSCFIIDYNNTPGITRIPILKKVGMWPAPTSELVFENAIIPKENLLGPLNKGFQICMWMLNNTRMGCATGATALGAACLEGAVNYANERTQFGQPIGKFQMIQQQIAEMKLEDDAAKLLGIQSGMAEREQASESAGDIDGEIIRLQRGGTRREHGNEDLRLLRLFDRISLRQIGSATRSSLRHWKVPPTSIWVSLPESNLATSRTDRQPLIKVISKMKDPERNQ